MPSKIILLTKALFKLISKHKKRRKTKMKYTTEQITVNKLGGLDKLEKEEIAVMILNESIKAGQWQSFSTDELNLLLDK
jgi:hypothetical protein